MTDLGRPRGLLGRIRRSVDWVVLTIAFALVTLAFINLNSAGATSWSPRVQAQAGWFGVGLVAMLAVTALDYRVLHRLAYPAYAFGIGLLGLVAVLGYTAKGAGRWLAIGSQRFQPSEVMKVLLIVALARFLNDRRRRAGSTAGLLAGIAMVVVPTVMVVRQPDLGTGIFLVLIAVSMLAATDLGFRGGLMLLSGAVLSLALMWRYGMLNYQRSRIDVWLDPELYADDEGYQTIQAMISVGNGGFFGRGIDAGTQNVLRFLPERFTDFPFAVYAEEWGFVGCTMLLTLYLSLVLWAINLASQARDRFAALLCLGVASLVFWHVVVNIGMVLQLFPVVGITLPFFSAGGSNLLTLMMALGILMSVSRARQAR